jgi:hypothetical protein
MAAASKRRRLQVVALYAALHDYDYEPETATGKLVRRQADPNGRVRSRADCPACAGEGQRRRRGLSVSCGRCRGHGTIAVDAYTRRPLGEQAERQRRYVRCDACGGGGAGRAPGVHANGHACRRCSESGRPGYVELRTRFRFFAPTAERAPASDEGDPVFRCLARRRQAGSFAELETATLLLRRRWEPGYRLLAAAYIERRRAPSQLPAPLRQRLELALTLVTSLMPEPIRVPRRVLEEAA